MISRLDCPIFPLIQPKLQAPKSILLRAGFPSHPAAVLLPPDVGPRGTSEDWKQMPSPAHLLVSAFVGKGADICLRHQNCKAESDL